MTEISDPLLKEYTQIQGDKSATVISVNCPCLAATASVTKGAE